MGMEYEKIHACPNDCILYRKEFAELRSCLKCGLSLYIYKSDLMEIISGTKVLNMSLMQLWMM